MSFTDILKQFVTQLMISARIVSPRFTDYQIEKVDYYSEVAGFEDIIRLEIERILEEKFPKGADEGGGIDREEIGLEVGSAGITEGMIAGKIRQASTIARTGAAGMAMGGLAFLPHAAIVAVAVAMAPIIMEELTRPGGVLDIRFRRYLEDEYNAGLDRQTQRNTQIGLRQVIIQSRAGFIQANGVANENTLRTLKEGGFNGQRVIDIDFISHARGNY